MSCSKTTGKKEEYRLPEFKREIERDFTTFGEEIPMQGKMLLYLYGDKIILVSYDIKTGNYLHFYNKGTGNHISSSLHKGRGPGEVLTAYDAKVIDGDIYIYDLINHSVLKYNLDKLLNSETDAFEGKIFSSGNVSDEDIIMNSDSTGIIINSTSFVNDAIDNNAARIEKIGKDKSEYSEYPLEDRMMTWYMYMTQSVTLSPDGKHLAIAPTFGAILEFFKVDDGIKLTECKYFIPPGIKTNNDGYEMTEKTSYGFTGLTSTNDRVYASMVDPKVKEKERKKAQLPLAPMLVSFDWKGRAILRVKTNYSIESLCVDEDESKIYAVVSDSSGVNYLAYIKID